MDGKHMKDDIMPFVIRLIEKKGKLQDNVDIASFNYIDSGYVDSIGIIKFVLELESHFGIALSDADIESTEFRTVGGLVSIIQNKMRGAVHD
jgi:acyl carrier protein